MSLTNENVVSSGFDLKSLYTKATAENGVEMLILHPIDGTAIKGEDGKPWTLTVVGTDSDKWKTAIRATQKKRGQDSENASEALVASLVVGSSANIVLDKSTGETFTYTPQSAIKLMIDYPWLRDQVNVYANDRANFLPKA